MEYAGLNKMQSDFIPLYGHYPIGMTFKTIENTISFKEIIILCFKTKEREKTKGE